MFSSMVKTDDWNEDGVGGHPSTLKRQAAYYFTVMPCPLAPLINLHHVQQSSSGD